MIKLLLLICLALLFTNCEKTINIDIEDKGRKLVLNSIISDTGYVAVNLYKSRFILDNENFNYVNAAEIILWENNIIVDTLNEITNGYYLSSIIPKNNFTYKISAKKDNLTVNSETKIPNKVGFQVVDTLSILKDNSNLLRIRLKIDDPKHEQNFYMIGLNLTNIDTTIYFIENSNIYFTTDENVFDIHFDNFAFISDRKFSGSSFIVNLYIDQWLYQYMGGTLLVNMMSISKDMYYYYLSLSKQLSTGSSPFTEPVMVFNNINGGYGIFSSFALSKDSINFPSPILLKK